jgi:hypothetical protein
MTDDPIVAEVHRAREKLWTECGGNRARLLDKYREIGAQMGGRAVTKEDLLKRRQATGKPQGSV